MRVTRPQTTPDRVDIQKPLVDFTPIKLAMPQGQSIITAWSQQRSNDARSTLEFEMKAIQHRNSSNFLINRVFTNSRMYVLYFSFTLLISTTSITDLSIHVSLQVPPRSSFLHLFHTCDLDQLQPPALPIIRLPLKTWSDLFRSQLKLWNGYLRKQDPWN